MIELPGCENLRDIGGYPTQSGATLAPGRLYRSAELCEVDRAVAAQVVEALGIRRVIDLRMEEEIRAGESTLLPPACERVHLPLITAVQPLWGDPTDRTPATTALRYLKMARQGRATLVRALSLLAEPPAKPTLIHCVAGRDRTGIVVACLLDLLDVPDEVIAADYALSAVMDDEEGRNASPENIARFLERVRAEHGSVREMLAESGLSPASLERLRSVFLAA